MPSPSGTLRAVDTRLSRGGHVAGSCPRSHCAERLILRFPGLLSRGVNQPLGTTHEGLFPADHSFVVVVVGGGGLVRDVLSFNIVQFIDYFLY